MKLTLAKKPRFTGGKLFATFSNAGFWDVQVSLVANVDTSGRLLGMVRNMAKYAAKSGTLEQTAIDEAVTKVEEILINERYLVVSPQFVVIGRKSS